MNKDENVNIEYKREFIDKIKNEIVAFLNTNGGTIYVGVNNDKTIYEPFKEIDRDKIDLEISNWLDHSIYPSTFELVKHNFTEDGILIINVLEGNHKPYYLRDKGPKPSGVFKRVGSSSRRATEEEILKMMLDSQKYIYEEDTSELQKLTFKYLSSIFDEKQIKFSIREYRTLGLLNKKNKYTNLAYLLSDQSNLVVKIARYDNNLNFLVKKRI